MEKPKIKKIAFIEPKAPGKHVYSHWGLPRLGTLILGAMLKDAGLDVSVYIEDIRGIDWQDVFNSDAVGISTITSTAPRAYEMANQIRKAGIPVFMGGPHVSFMAEEALGHCDFVLCGEAEESIRPFIDALSRGEGFEGVPGLARMEGGSLRKNPLPTACTDLDKYPIPDMGLIKGTRNFTGDLSVTPVMTSRGCPFGCNFCSVTSMFGRKYRFRSVASVIEELKMRNPEWVFFYDDNFAANKDHTKELLTRMIREKIEPKWMAQVRIDISKDAELLDLMVRSNCRRVYIGLESINPKTLKSLNKGQTPEDIEQAIATIQGRGIQIHGMFIFGSDHDDPRTIKETVKFAKRNGLSSVQFMILTPLPGTLVFDQMEKEGRLLSRDWGYYDAHHVVFMPKKMSFFELQAMTLRAMLKFYSLRHILHAVNRFDLWTTFIRAYGWRLTRDTKKHLAEFTEHLKDKYEELGTGIDSARHSIELRARKTSEDLKDLFRSINRDGIRKFREKKL